MRFLTCLAAGCLFAAAPAWAQSQDHAVYDAAYYAPMQPQTAFDMIGRTPGFTLQEGDNRRGYAGSLGNVLIDGRRPVGKSQTVADALKLIPASQVVRVELLSGADVAGDPSGFAVLANVVRVSSAGQGLWSLGFETANRDRPAINGFANWSGRHGQTTYDIGGETYSLHRALDARYRDTDAAGNLLGTGVEQSPRTYYEYAVNGSAARPWLGGALSLSGKAKASRYHETTTLTTTARDGGTTGQVTPYTETTNTLELGTEFDRDAGPWRLSAIGLLTRTHFFSAVSATQWPSGDRFQQRLDHRGAENIARVSLARTFGRHRIEFGYERAVNSLRAALDLTFATGSVVYPITVPDSNSVITERRDDLYAADRWQVAPDLTVDLRMGYERPVLAFAGDTDKHVAYAFAKPSMTLTRTFGRDQVSLRFYRDIGQIDFNDFVSAASLKDAVINGGNPDLRPQTQWRTELTGNLRFGAATTLDVKLYRTVLDDTADLVPVTKDGVAYDAPGNIGRGTITGASISLHLPLGRWVPGGSVQADLMQQGSRVVDPLTRQVRDISNLPEFTRRLSFRQDVKGRRFAWGIDYSDASGSTKYRFNETDTARDAPQLSVYAEKGGLGVYTLKATIYSDAGVAARRQRVFYAPDRAGVIARTEVQTRRPGFWLNVALSRSF